MVVVVSADRGGPSQAGEGTANQTQTFLPFTYQLYHHEFLRFDTDSGENLFFFPR